MFNRRSPSALLSVASLLSGVFRTYRAEAKRPLSDHRKRRLALDERRAFDLQQRDLAAEKRKNKDRYGVLRIRDHGGVPEKLRKMLGGKSMRRILKAERRAARNSPDALVVEGKLGFSAPMQRLQRGVDFALVPAGHGGPTLVLNDRVTEFRVACDEASLDDTFALNC